MNKSSKPKFIDSPFYKDGVLSKDAPEDLRQEYEDFMNGDEEHDIEDVPQLKESDLG